MTIRPALLAVLLAMGALFALFGLAPHQATPALADEVLRATPTPSGLAPAMPAPAPQTSEAMPPLPDLLVESIIVSPNPPMVNRPVTIEVTIRNAGEAPLGATNNFFVDLYLDPDVPPRACLPGDYYWSVQGYELASGSLTLTLIIDPERSPLGEAFQDVGIVSVWAQVDNATDSGGNRCGNVVESREDNNLRAAAVDVETLGEWLQTTHEDFQAGFSSALDLTHPAGILQNGTGWFDEPRFPQPEDPEWPLDPTAPWDSATFYNPDLHIETNNLPDNFPTSDLDDWNPPDQENVDIQAGFQPNELFAVWEDASCGDLYDRDILFSYGVQADPDGDEEGVFTWSEPIRLNRDKPAPGDPDYNPNLPCAGPAHNQLRPQLVIDRAGQRLFVFWQDTRLGDYDIFFARSLDPYPDTSAEWEEPSIPTNPVNDKDVDPNADQMNVTAEAFNEEINCFEAPNGVWNCDPGPTHLFVAWEDYRNGNADIFAEWSPDGGDTWQKTDDADATTLDANIHVQPDPVTNAGIFDQRHPHLSLDRQRSDGPINYCITSKLLIHDLSVGDAYWHYYPENPLPRVFLVWEDERGITQGDQSDIFYTRGEFNYFVPAWVQPNNFSEGTVCPIDARDPDSPDGWRPWQGNEKDNLPRYRYEDDHVQVNQDAPGAAQFNPVGGFSLGGFLALDDVGVSTYLTDTERLLPIEEVQPAQFRSDYTTPGPNPVTFSFHCEVRLPVEEFVITWEDSRDGQSDIWAANIFDDIPFRLVYARIGPVLASDPAAMDLFDERLAVSACERDPDRPLLINTPTLVRNRRLFSPQPYEFYALALPESEIKISEANTFEPKPMCEAPDEPDPYEATAQQQRPDMVVLTDNVSRPRELLGDVIGPPTNVPYNYTYDSFAATTIWAAWEDDRAFGEFNQDIFLRPIVRFDNRRVLTDTLRFTDPDTGPVPIPSQVVQDNVKNQIMLRQWDLYEDYRPASVEQSSPSLSLLKAGPEEFYLYVGWHDNRNANPLIGFEGNKDVFAARMNLDVPQDYLNEQEVHYDYPEDFIDDAWFPMRTATFVSSVFDTGGSEVTWYDIDWWGDISADGVLAIQTRFGLDPDQPEPPMENVAANGWTQWTGIGGTGGFYTAPGQHIAGPDGDQFPTSYYIQYRVNFNPSGGGQQGIICLTEVELNFQRPDTELYLPLSLGGSGEDPGGGGGTEERGAVEGQVSNAVTGEPISGAEVCVQEDAAPLCDTTDSTGAYQIEEAPAGSQILEARASGFIPLQLPIEIPAGQRAVQTLALSPLLNEGELRVVLTWDENPRDLDSHLWLPPETPYHIYYINLGSCDGFPFACLDIDDVTSFGPETTTVVQRVPGTYPYGVYHYAGTGTLATSGARVQVYGGAGLLAEFQVPAVGEGRWWHVFNLDGDTGAITPVNTISDESPGLYTIVSAEEAKRSTVEAEKR